MALSKQTQSNRSTTDPLSHGIQLDPIHRDSITYPLQPRRSSLAPAASSAMSRTAGQGKKVAKQKPLSSSQINTRSLPPLRETMPNNDGDGSPHFNGWMTIWGEERPQKDMGTCCIGFWFPPALYGKTHWRLQQVSAGKNPDDHEWKFSQGCNGACWTMSALSGMGGILIGAQRSQIRGTYGIHGSITQDACLGLFLPWCTQIQNDREVRAREGAQELRNSKKYKDFEKSNGLVDQQPGRVPPMNLPGGLNQLSKDRQIDNPSSTKVNNAVPLNTANNRHLARGTKPVKAGLSIKTNNDKFAPGTESNRARSKPSPKAAGNGLKQENSTKAFHPQLPRGYDGVDSIVMATYVQEDNTTQPAIPEPKKPLIRRGGQFGNEPNQLHRSADFHGEKSFQFPLPECDSIVATSKGVVVRHSPKNIQKDLSYVHDFTGSPIDKDVLEHYEREERKSYGTSRENTKENSKGKYTEHALDDCTRIASGMSNSEHNLNDGSQADPVQATARPQEHILKDCTPVVSEEMSTSPHELTNCTSVFPTSGTTTPQHTLGDCNPILSLPGTRTPQHALGNTTPTIATSGRTTPQYTLEDCSMFLPAPKGSASQHSRDEHGSDTSANEAGVAQTTAPKDGTKQHSLEECELVPSFKRPSIPQHTIKNCEPTPASSKNTNGQDGNLNEDFLAVPLKGATASQHTLSEDSQITNYERTKLSQQHTLEDDESIPANAVKENEHALADCSLRASLQSADTEQHDLADCSARVSFDPGQTNEHNLNYCSSRPNSGRSSIERRSSSLESPRAENSSKKQILGTREHRIASCPALPARVVAEDEGKAASPQPADSYRSGQSPEPVKATVKDHNRTATDDDFKLSSSTENDQRKIVTGQDKNQSNRKAIKPKSAERGFKKQRKEKKSRKASEATSKITGTNKQNKEPKLEIAAQKSIKRSVSPNPSETSATPSMAQQSLAHILAQNGSKWKKNTQLDGAMDLAPEPVESHSIAIHVPHEFCD